MAEMRSCDKDKGRRAVIERLWLSYYNDILFSKGLITEEQRNKMRLKIKAREGFAAR